MVRSYLYGYSSTHGSTPPPATHEQIHVTADTLKAWVYTKGREKGWERNFVPKNFHGIDSERFPLFRERKSSFRGIPSSAEEPIPKLGTERNGLDFREKIKFYGAV